MIEDLGYGWSFAYIRADLFRKAPLNATVEYKKMDKECIALYWNKWHAADTGKSDLGSIRCRWSSEL